MSLAAPFWLLLLIPWLAVLLYLMLGKPPKESVPFLWLWRGPAARRTTKPSLSKLPLWIALLMLAALTAIAAAAGPRLARDDSPPAPLPAQAGMSGVAVRGNQVMVRVLNESPQRDTSLAVRWKGGDRIEPIQLPQNGERSYFLDIPPDLRELAVSLNSQTITMTRRRAWPRIEARMPLSDSLRRVIAAYEKSRPSGDDSPTVAIAGDEAVLDGQAGIILAEPTASATGRPVVTDHAVTANVDWPGALIGTRLAAAEPSGFVPLVRLGDRVAVAVRDSPRQVWIGIDSPDIASRVDYVVLWTNVFDFAGQGADEWRPAPGTQFTQASAPKPVQKHVQNAVPWLVCASVILLTLGLVAAGRRVQLR